MIPKSNSKGSKQVDDGKPEYIDGLKPGQFFNTVSGKVYGDEQNMIVHGYFHNFVIWKGPKGNGTFSGTMTTDEFAEFEKKNQLTRDGGDLVQVVNGEELRYTDTHTFIVTLPDHIEDGIMLYPLSSTGCKVARKWNSLWQTRKIRNEEGAIVQSKRYATLWNLKTAGFESNGFGYRQVSTIKPVGWNDASIMKYGADLEGMVEAIKTSGAKESYEAHESSGESVEDSDF